MIKTALIDLDDTLCEVTSFYDKAIARTANIFCNKYPNHTISEIKREMIIMHSNLTSEMFATGAAHNKLIAFQRLTESILGKVDIDLTLRMSKNYYEFIIENIKIYPDSMTLVSGLKSQGIKIVIVSDGTTAIRLKILKKLGIDNYIDFLVTSEEANVNKPNPYSYMQAAHKANTPPENCIVIGNSLESDIQVAGKLNMKSVLVSRKVNQLDNTVRFQPDYEVSDLEEILGIIEFINKN